MSPEICKLLQQKRQFNCIGMSLLTHLVENEHLFRSMFLGDRAQMYPMNNLTMYTFKLDVHWITSLETSKG